MFLSTVPHIRMGRRQVALWFSKRQEEVETWMSPGSVMGRKKDTLVSQQGSTYRVGEMRSNVLRRARSQSALTTNQWSQSLEYIHIRFWSRGWAGTTKMSPGPARRLLQRSRWGQQGLNGSWVERKKERSQQRSVPEGDARGHGGERARVKRRLLWAHRASGPRTEATQLLPQGPDLL